ncbi:alpha/beta hydrolase family protein [Hymenobacter jeollabukensis]|uniref:Alpha/beta hydrolase n=1 Tax=Hymenobacter jeollabukensis TaxID=2025313 RepID=A0A5R8WXB0_9BACT|nr:alpha/beta hydrolase [Hymenobacter jeollabukensis]TLM96834.1 alpha/beta hydrolase [Hymenobacter jeollabukensis]
MKKLFASGFGWLLLVVLCPLLAAAQTQPAVKATLEGEWKGPLTVPGGTLPLSITVTELANGTRFAVLSVPAQRINRALLTVDLKADTVIFDSQELGCSYVCLRSADGQQLQGQWRQQGFAPSSLTLQFTPLPPQPKTFKFPPPYRVEDVAFTSAHDNTKLAGTLTVPPGEGPFPAVLLLSDLGPQDRDATQGDYKLFGAMADYLTRHGVAVLRLDDRGVGQSGGDWRSATPLDLQKDAQVALNFLRTRPRIDIAQLGIIGVGTGANVALEVAAQPLGPAFVVSLAGAGTPGYEVMAQRPALGFLKAGEADTAQENAARRRLRQQQTTAEKVAELRAKGANSAQIDTYVGQQQMRQRAADKKQLDGRYKRQRPMMEIVRHTADNGQAQAIVLNMLRQQQPDLPVADAQALAAEMTAPWYRAYLNYTPTANFGQLRAAMLLLHGTDDQQLQPSNLNALEKALKDNKRAQFRRLEGFNHTFQAPPQEWPLINGQQQPVVSQQVQLLILEWIRKQVKG